MLMSTRRRSAAKAVPARRAYTRDRAPANGSSTAFVARYGRGSVLCAADAHAEVLEAALDRLGPGPHPFTAVKLSHHGSKHNLSPGLLSRIRSKHWLVSTNGANFTTPTLMRWHESSSRRTNRRSTSTT